ncbi:cytochrome c maturation protein CcmE [Thalassotalea sp. PS06]|uniref:cytochrome c maturation protein CcmE n=1 Tax=Thalassotalea sp. PS06 TaxID=2594005 RepID=UPI001165BF74|nr:cytochrome c maturation protein CcmE [Thalassotalea sp. PS06]QDP00570.1 cytochrome c maturation protein CcmE [Thalassotalea sp. PS06]
MNPRRKKRLTIISLILFGVATVAGLSLYGLSNFVDVFYTPSEVHNGKEDGTLKPEVGQNIRVGGLVVVGSVKRDPETLKVSFDLIDSGPMITVQYEGILPDLFREGQGIVAQGELIEPTTLLATEVLAKHDEEYMPKEIADAVGKHHNPDKYN